MVEARHVDFRFEGLEGNNKYFYKCYKINSDDLLGEIRFWVDGGSVRFDFDVWFFINNDELDEIMDFIKNKMVETIQFQVQKKERAPYYAWNRIKNELDITPGISRDEFEKSFKEKWAQLKLVVGRG